MPRDFRPALSTAWTHFITTVGAGLLAGRNCAPSSAPNTGTREKVYQVKKNSSHFY